MTGSLGAPLISAQDAKLYDLSLSRPRGAGGNVASLQRAVTHCGFFDNPSVDFDGVYRRVPLMQQYAGAIYPSLALRVAQLALGDAPVRLDFDLPGASSSLHLEDVSVGHDRQSVE